MRIMIAGGGTGGHVYPGIAMYDALRRRMGDVEVLFVGARAGVERRIFDDLGLPNVLLPGRGVRGKGLGTKLISPLILLAGVARGIREILAFKPDVVIGTGGYASVAVVAASILCNRKRVLQEQNSVPGLANRMLSRFADLVLLSYEESRAFLGRRVPAAVVGNPIRVKQPPDRGAALDFFDFEPDVPVVLICGGSRGARSINEAAVDAIKGLIERRDLQFVFLTGDLDYETVRSQLGLAGREERGERKGERPDAHGEKEPRADLARRVGIEKRVRIYPFLQEMNHAYSAADVAVSRAGASAVFELAAFGVPTVFVPYPYAADDHQRKNVSALGAAGAAVVVEDRSFTGGQLETIIETLLDDEERRGTMRRKTRTWARADADSLAAEKILELVPEHRMCSVGNAAADTCGVAPTVDAEGALATSSCAAVAGHCGPGSRR
ncbi:MAG: undecaprenyldiphospho-muramoylpentapeptide beta-N-acetylglucosaminyltransferase [bacterium]